MGVTTYTASPSTILPGQILGAPISHLPWVFLCGQGERFCGWGRIANTQRQAMESMAAKRQHEENCGGGLITVGSCA